LESAPINLRKLKSKKMNLRASVIFAILAAAFAVMPLNGAPPDEVRTGVFPFYPYAARYDMWHFTPMDQGGRLIQLQVIGSESDVEVVKAVRSPGFFAPWGDPIRWDSLEKKEIEKSVWLNRWYILPCFARQYYLTGDKGYLKEVLTFIRKWTAENPVPPNLPEYFAKRRYNWRDMQVAWRMQNLAWVYFLGQDGFTAAERRELYELVAVHARVLLEYFGKQPLHENNHQSHGATAMLFAALLFPDLPDATGLKERAFVILNHHLDQAFYEDGNSIELTPGYYPFFVSVFRDALLLCRANHVAPPPRCEERLKQFYAFLGTVVQPNGRMPPINDSTESDPSATVRVVADLLGLPAPYPAPGSHWFSASDQGVMRDASTTSPAYAFLDAGPKVLAHWHGGKLGFQLWYWDKAFLVDSGICNYDDPLRLSWYFKPQAHNTVLVDGEGDYDPTMVHKVKKVAAGSRIVKWESNDRYDWAVMLHEGFQDRQSPVTWVRHFIMLKSFGTLLVDQLESEGEHHYTWLFHLLPCSPVVDAKSAFTAFPEKNLLLLPATSEALAEPILADGNINRQGRNLTAPVVKYETHATNALQTYLLLPVAGADCPATRLEQVTKGNTVTVTISGSSGEKRVNIIRSKRGDADDYRLSLEEVPAGVTPSGSGRPR
jgi:hypothetical protein